MTVISRPTGPAPFQKWPVPIKMGVRSCSPQTWLSDDDYFGQQGVASVQIAEKSRLYKTQFDDIFAYCTGSEAAGREAWALIAENRKKFHNHVMTWDENMHPLDCAARQLPCDLVLLSADNSTGGTQWVLSAGAVAFPAHWQLSDKLGLPMLAVHAPAPDYAHTLSHPVDRFFNNMQPGLFSRRFNWTLQVDHALHTPLRVPSAPLQADEVANRLFVRVETQSFVKLPVSRWILFTIRTSLCPVGCWSDDTDALLALMECHRNMSVEMAEYRNSADYLPALTTWVNTKM